MPPHLQCNTREMARCGLDAAWPGTKTSKLASKLTTGDTGMNLNLQKPAMDLKHRLEYLGIVLDTVLARLHESIVLWRQYHLPSSIPDPSNAASCHYGIIRKSWTNWFTYTEDQVVSSFEVGGDPSFWSLSKSSQLMPVWQVGEASKTPCPCKGLDW